jgi:hypothetical protein
MEFIFERDSVCAGDDVCAPNRQIVNFAGPPLLSDICSGDHALKYLPSVSDAKTKWTVVIGGIRVAHVWHSYASIRKIEVQMLEHDKTTYEKRAFFQYDSQSKLVMIHT